MLCVLPFFPMKIVFYDYNNDGGDDNDDYINIHLFRVYFLPDAKHFT